MKTFRKISNIIFCGILATTLLLSGCGASEAPGSSSEETKTNASASTEKSSSNTSVTQKKIVLKLASTQSPEMGAIKSLKRMADNVKSKTHGEVEVQIFPSSQLGDQRDYLEGLSMGTVEMCLMATGALEGFEPKMALFGVPYLFKSSKQIHSFYESDTCQKILDEYRNSHGIRVIGLYDEGIRNSWTSKKPIRTFEDFSGIKLRVPEVPIYVQMFKAIGANPTPMVWSDVYTGLQTGVIEGVENNVEMITTSKLTDIIKYETLTQHVYSTLFLMISEQAFQKMSPENQKIFMDCVKEGNVDAFAKFEESQKKAHEEIVAAGIEVIELSASEKTKFAEKFNAITKEKLASLFDNSEELYNEIAAIPE
ncbi:TRAP transporter substrate-binding protein [Petroclostridium sp. X23]|uniref:TRAP transporter substrate-binding protein n=1 Tax=Petroclostridium sp. X23 TaxID=3045146 RepID=UPI0024ACBBD3|nr:TRAP transporter substrate-binding protein [Petroclostridium sp. X23]WHH57081.1 TRAP transporter substrate-binding protein [Petroclostridium sp. X23]